MLIGILLTLLTGFFFLIGIIYLTRLNNKEEISLFTTSLAFVVMLGLILFDILPELIETKNIYLIIPVFLGLIILIILDKFIPNHHHTHHEINDNHLEHENHLNHIGIITIMALTIHNLLEGISLYSLTLKSVSSGIFLMISISLHNIPLGFQIGSSIKSKKNSFLLILLLCFSAFLGSLIIIIFGELNETIINFLLSITLGMLLYILIFELFSEMKNSIKKKSTIYGIILGVIVLIITIII